MIPAYLPTLLCDQLVIRWQNLLYAILSDDSEGELKNGEQSELSVKENRWLLNCSNSAVLILFILVSIH